LTAKKKRERRTFCTVALFFWVVALHLIQRKASSILLGLVTCGVARAWAKVTLRIVFDNSMRLPLNMNYTTINEPPPGALIAGIIKVIFYLLWLILATGHGSSTSGGIFSESRCDYY
jgi:hypothetical protein